MASGGASGGLGSELRLSEPSSQGSASVDFAAEILRDVSRRNYGFGSLLPEWVRYAVDYSRHHDPDSIIEKNKNRGKQLLRLRRQFRGDEAADHAVLPEHLRRLYHEKNFRLLEHYGRRAAEKFPETKAKVEDVVSIVGKMRSGLIDQGDILPSGFWRSKPEDEVQSQKEAAQMAAASRPKGPPTEHWCEEEDIENMWQQTAKHIEKKLWSVVGYSDDGVDYSKTAYPKVFPVHQHEKIRMCVDFRQKNLRVIAHEKMRLIGVRGAIELMCRVVSPHKHLVPFMQFRDDVAEDVEFEKEQRAEMEAAAKEDRRAMILRDVANMDAAFQQAQEFDSHPPAGNWTCYFPPRSAKRDLKGYYYQFGVRFPEQNRLWVPMPRSLKRGKGKKRRWALVQSDCALFGAIVSVYECVHMSELLMLIFAGYLGLIITIYIDDLHLTSRPEALKEDEALMDLALECFGFEQSGDKRESHSAVQRCLVILGIAYEIVDIPPCLKLSVSIEKCKRLQLMGKRLVDQFARREVEHDLLLSFRGLYRHVTQLNNTLNHMVRGLDKWADEETFKTRIRDRRSRQSLKRLVRLLCALQERQLSLKISTETTGLKMAHLYTDASLEDLKSLNEKLARGVRTDLGVHDMWIGAVLVTPDGKRQGFRVKVDRLPPFVNYAHIGVLEFLALRAATHVFQKEMKQHLTICHMDNLSNVYISCRNSANCSITQNLAASWACFTVNRNIRTYSSWIATRRNLADVLTREERFSLLLKTFPDTVMLDIELRPLLRPFIWQPPYRFVPVDLS